MSSLKVIGFHFSKALPPPLGFGGGVRPAGFSTHTEAEQQGLLSILCLPASVFGCNEANILFFEELLLFGEGGGESLSVKAGGLESEA